MAKRLTAETVARTIAHGRATNRPTPFWMLPETTSAASGGGGRCGFARGNPRQIFLMISMK